MKLYLRQIQDIIIFREETSLVKERYECRANRSDEYYHFYRTINFFKNEYYQYSKINPVKKNGNKIQGFWRIQDTPELAQVIFFRPNNCSCGQKYCVHEQLFKFIQELLEYKNVNTNNVALNIMKYIEF